MDADLESVAEAHGVATWYEDWHRERREVSAQSVIGVLALLGVDVSTPAAVARALDDVRATRRDATLPGTMVVRHGSGRPLAEPGTIVLEDGTSRDVTEVPDDLPLGWHRLSAGGQDLTLVVVPARRGRTRQCRRSAGTAGWRNGGWTANTATPAPAAWA